MRFRSRWTVLGSVLALSWLADTARAQNLSIYDDFSTPILEVSRWTPINEDGTDQASSNTSCGYLSITGVPNRAGFASRVRLSSKSVVEVDALGWTGTNQILQLTSAESSYQNVVEFIPEGLDPDGTPLLNVWTNNSRVFRQRSPISGLINPLRPLRLRIERNGNAYRFLANGIQVFTTNTSALNGDARVVLYGWNTSVGHWDNVRMSGPEVRLTSPLPDSLIAGDLPVRGVVGPEAASWTLQWGQGQVPTIWTTVATGSGGADGLLGQWNSTMAADGAVTFRLTASDAQGYGRTFFSTVVLDRARLWEPLNGQVVGPAFTAAVTAGAKATRVRFYDNGLLAAVSDKAPFWGRVFPSSDGAHTISARVLYEDGRESEVAPVQVTVQRQLFGMNTRVADRGRAFRFPDGKTTIAIAHQDGYPWPPVRDLWDTGNTVTTEAYLAKLANSGVNVIRMWLESAVTVDELLENPIGNWNPKTVAFWDRFLPLCEKYGITVLLSPWETYWINLHWNMHPYNAVNGGPCATVRDFLVHPAARQAQKNRLKFMVDRWGNSTAIFAYDILNEYDIWWEPATVAERNAWVDDMVRYLQDYELEKWGHRHMVTVSTTKNEPAGSLADTAFRHPLLDFATTHFYYPGTVNDPENIVDPALSVNHGIRYALSQIQDGRPFTDSEWGPIDLWPTVLDETFDNLYYHHFSWAHFSSGGTGTGMRFPNRDPFTLTDGMHAAQKAIAMTSDDFVWESFRPENLDSRLSTGLPNVIAMGSGDERQAIVWLSQDVRQGPVQLIRNAQLTISGFTDGRYLVRVRHPVDGSSLARQVVSPVGSSLVIPLPPMSLNLAVTVRRIEAGDVSGDMSVDWQDVILALQSAGGLQTPTLDETEAGDLNADTRLGLADAASIARIAAGLSP